MQELRRMCSLFAGRTQGGDKSRPSVGRGNVRSGGERTRERDMASMPGARRYLSDDLIVSTVDYERGAYINRQTELDLTCDPLR